jgi:hypothetical protein
MDYRIAVLHGRPIPVAGEEVTLHLLGTGRQAARTGRVANQGLHAPTVREEPLSGVAANEPRSASKKNRFQAWVPVGGSGCSSAFHNGILMRIQTGLLPEFSDSQNMQDALKIV